VDLMGEAIITRRVQLEPTPTPDITLVSKTDTEITFTITNNSSESATIYWEVGDTTPDANTLTLLANGTSGNLTAGGLTEITEYTIYASAKSSGFTLSETASLTETTDSSATVLTGNQIPWRSGSTTIGGQYFTSATAYNLPQYPQVMNVTATDPMWNNTDFNPDTSVIGEKFAVKLQTNALKNTSNSCAGPSSLYVVVQDNSTGAFRAHQIVGAGGNSPGPASGACGNTWTGSPVTQSLTSNGVSYTRTTWAKGNVAGTIEVTTDGLVLVNGTQRDSNVKCVYAQVYAGYDGGSMTGNVDYLIYPI
jgi:hypothetical protein